MTVPAILGAISAALVAVVAGRHDRKHVLLFLSALLTGSSVICALSPSFPVLLIGRALLGVSLGASLALSLSVVGAVAPPAKIHAAAASVFAGVTAAMIFGLPIGAYISEALSWRYAFGLSAVIGVLVLGFQAFALPEIKIKNEFRFSEYTKFIRSSGAAASLVIILLGHAAHFGAYTFLAPALAEVGVSGKNLTYSLAMFGVIGLIANFLVSRFVSVFNFACLLSMQLLLAVALLLIPAYDTSTQRLLGMALWGVAWGGLPLSLNMWNRTVPGGGGESGSSLFILTAQIAIALGSGIGGKIYDVAGVAADYTLWALISLLSAAILVASKIRKTQHEGC